LSERLISSIHELVEVDIHAFRDATRDISFDIYLKLSETNVAHIFSRTTGLDYKRLAQYIQKGVKTLYIHPEDLDSFKLFVARPASAILEDSKTSQEKKIAALLNMTEQNMAELFSQITVRDETALNTKKLVSNYVTLLTQSPNTLATILRLVSHGEYLYYHSIAVAIFSVFIAKATGQFDQKSLEQVGLGGFLHDIGATQLPKDVVCSPLELSDQQWDSMHGHTKLGLKMIESTQSIPDEVRYIVYQHHEEPGGAGYPNKIAGPVIYYPAKVVAIADAFSALISKRPFRPAYSVENAIQILQESKGKYDPALVDIVTSIFSRKQIPSKLAA
jgi:putative nucleotidyltransferase with HDIG domain